MKRNAHSISVDKISVIIPIYNTEAYLRKCLNSVLVQTYQNFEIICVDDGSTDLSGEILKQYAAEDSRIQVIFQQNMGQSEARNVALSNVKGKYVYFLDSDDFIHPQTLEVLYRVLKESECAIAVTKQTKIYDANPIDISNLQYVIKKPALLNILQNEESGSVVWNKLYRADLVRNRKFIKGIYFEDWPWITCLFADIDAYTEVPYGLYAYNTDNVSTMRSTFDISKVGHFIIGIRAVWHYFSDETRKHLWPMVRKKRISVSIKHMVNAVYHERQNQPVLDDFLLSMLYQLRQAECFYYYELSLKVIMRILKIWFRNRRRK